MMVCREQAVVCSGAVLFALASNTLLRAADPATSSAADSPIVITELLYNVPAGMDGDATADGERDAVGDEFIELYNTSDQPVSLRGWTITNRLRAAGADEDAADNDAGAKGSSKSKSARGVRGVSFTFPTFDLPSKGVVVVFNGHQSKIPGPAGDSRKAPSKPNDNFSNAWVFTMDNEGRFNAFNNAADFALLSDKSGTPIDCIVWGKPDTDPPASTQRLAKTKSGDPKGSVTREPTDDELTTHRKLDATPCSPGRIAKRDVEKELEEAKPKRRDRDDSRKSDSPPRE